MATRTRCFRIPDDLYAAMQAAAAAAGVDVSTWVRNGLEVLVTADL